MKSYLLAIFCFSLLQCTNNGNTVIFVDSDTDIDSNIFINVNLAGLSSGCPSFTSRYQTDQGYEICVRDDVELPDLSDGEVISNCERIGEGIIGFSWEVQNQLSDYDCPEAFEKSIENNQVQCLLKNIDLPNEEQVISFCDHIQDGFIGFFWDDHQEEDQDNIENPEPEDIFSPCEDDFNYLVDEKGNRYCLLTELDLPDSDGLQADCKSLDQGQLSFSWSLTDSSNYNCPQNFQYSEKDFIGTCTYKNIDLPNVENIYPVCHKLEERILGYSW